MAKLNLTFHEVVRQSGLSERTVKGLLQGSHLPHAKTLHRLAQGLGIDSDELFQQPSQLSYRLFDRGTNPAVNELVEQQPQLFVDWTERDFDALYSQFGIGGALTEDGALHLVHKMNRQRNLHHKASVLLESNEAELFAAVIELLFQRVQVTAPEFFST